MCSFSARGLCSTKHSSLYSYESTVYFMIVLLVCFTVLLVVDILMLHLICLTSNMIPHRVSNMGRTCTFQKRLKVGMDCIIYRRAYSSYIINIDGSQC